MIALFITIALQPESNLLKYTVTGVISRVVSRFSFHLFSVGMLAAAIAFCSIFTATSTAAGQLEVDSEVSGPFSLVGHTGKPVADHDFRGKFMLVFFGYTFCPDVCPMDLQIIARAMDILGEAGDRVQPIFITLDPERDTLEVVTGYASYFHPRIIGLTGSRRQVAEAAQNYGVISMKVVNENEPENYTINHSALIYLLGPDGRFAAAFDHGTDPGILATGILQHLTSLE